MTELWVERTGVRRYTGHSSRGAQVLVGSEDVDGVFTPGELMKIALAACSGMSSDQPLARRLGDDYQATVRVSGDADREQERYPLLAGDPRDRPVGVVRRREGTRLLIVVERAVDQVCTVGRTLKSGTKVTFEVADVGVLTSGSPPGCTGGCRGLVSAGGPARRALELGLTGYAANRADGRVQVVAQGPVTRASSCCTCCRAAPRPAASTTSSPTGRSHRRTSKGSARASPVEASRARDGRQRVPRRRRAFAGSLARRVPQESDAEGLQVLRLADDSALSSPASPPSSGPTARASPTWSTRWPG